MRVCVQTKVRAIVRARKRKDEDEETRRQKDMKEKKEKRLWGPMKVQTSLEKPVAEA